MIFWKSGKVKNVFTTGKNKNLSEIAEFWYPNIANIIKLIERVKETFL